MNPPLALQVTMVSQVMGASDGQQAIRPLESKDAACQENVESSKLLSIIIDLNSLWKVILTQYNILLECHSPTKYTYQKDIFLFNTDAHTI